MFNEARKKEYYSIKEAPSQKQLKKRLRKKQKTISLAIDGWPYLVSVAIDTITENGNTVLVTGFAINGPHQDYCTVSFDYSGSAKKGVLIY